METNYAFRNLAVNSLSHFQEEDFVYDFFHYYQSKGPIRNSIFHGTDWYSENIKRNLDWFENALQNFESEIRQVIHTTNQNTINEYFETLKGFKEGRLVIDVSYLRVTFNSWNKAIYGEFEKKVEVQTDLFFQNADRKMEHLQEYEEPKYSFVGLMVFGGGNYLPQQMEKRINYNFYVIEDVPNLLDLDHFDEYIKLLKWLKAKFETLINKYITQYDQGKIVATNNVIVHHVDTLQAAHAILNSNDKEQKQLPPGQKQKIKFAGTPQDFVAMFAPLITGRTFYLNKKSESDTDPLVKLLHDAFEIKKAKGEGEVALGSLCTYFKEYNSPYQKTKV